MFGAERVDDPYVPASPRVPLDRGRDDLPLASLVLDPAGNAARVNAAWTELTGLSHVGSLGQGWERALDRSCRDDAVRRLRDAAARQRSGSDDWQLLEPAGEHWTRWWWRPRPDDQLVVCVADIERDKAREIELWQRATHDPLTGLVNRWQLTSAIDRALERHKRSGELAAVLFADLDGFKAVNDCFGHQTGDEVLRRVAERLRAAVRPSDVVARLGGDEFAVLCEDLADPAEARGVAERLGAAVRAPLAVEGRLLSVEASIGIAVSAGADRAEALLARADSAMYAARAVRRAAHGATAPLDLRAGAGEPTAALLAAQHDAIVARVEALATDLRALTARAGAPVAPDLASVAASLDQLVVDLRTGALSETTE